MHILIIHTYIRNYSTDHFEFVTRMHYLVSITLEHQKHFSSLQAILQVLDRTILRVQVLTKMRMKADNVHRSAPSCLAKCWILLFAVAISACRTHHASSMCTVSQILPDGLWLVEFHIVLARAV